MKNANELTLGGGDLYVENQDFGYLGGSVTVSTVTEVVKFMTGVPRKLITQAVTALSRTIKASAMQCSAEQLGRALGFGSVTNIGAVAGSTVNITNEAATFDLTPEGDEGIRLVNGGATNIVIKSSDGQTTYVLNDDYTIEGNNGIKRVSSGSITSGGTVSVSYSYSVPATPASKRLKLGAEWELQTLNNVKFVHTRPDGGIVTVFMPKAQVVPGTMDLVFNTEANQFMSFDITIQAIADETSADAPLGYIDIREPEENND